MGLLAALFLMSVVVIAAFAPWVAPYSATAQDQTAINNPPSPSYRLGTDSLGRDVASGVVYGARTSLLVGWASAFVGAAIGLLWGLASGYFGGKTDLISQRLLEVLMALPALVLAIALATALGGSMLTVIAAVAFTRIPLTARVIRGAALSLREMEYVLAAAAIGAGPFRIMIRHVAPGCFGLFLVLLTAHVGVAIVLEATLGFLGIGLPPDTVSWGRMLGGALSYSALPSWWLVVFPGVAITAVSFCFNLLGDALRDLVDPRLRNVR